MSYKTSQQMFGKLAKAAAAQEHAEREAAADRQRRADEEEARLDAPISRRELLDAIQDVSRNYSGSGFPEQEIVCDAFAKLAAALS